MKLEESARNYYDAKRKNCAESILLACNDTYHLGLDADMADSLFIGFGAGIGCGKICGCLAASVGILGVLFKDRENFRPLCKEFVEEFQEKMGADSINCSELAAKYKNSETRCLSTVILAAQVLENFIEKKKNA